MLSHLKEARDLGKIRLIGGESLVSLPVKFSKDSRYFFCCGGENVYVYSTETAELVRELKAHTGNVTGFCVNSKNEFQLVSCSLDGLVIVWDYTDGAILKKFELGIQLFGVFTHPSHEDLIFVVRKSATRARHMKQKLAVLDLNDKEPSDEKDLDNLFTFSGSPWNFAFSQKGKFIAYLKNKEFGIWNTKTKESKFFTYKDSVFTCVAFHPFEFCLATGDTEGRIVIWQSLLSKRPVSMELHWHAHAISSLSFSHDGSYVMSGGQESVLVMWQYASNCRQFVPRMGAGILHVSCSHDDQVIAVSHQDNVIKLLSGVDLSFKKIILGLRKATYICKKLVFDPQSGALVMNSMPGVLQFYNPNIDKGLFLVDVVKQNVISKTDTEKLYFTQVNFVCFNDDGKWMATIEYRNDHYTSEETRLKFWEFNTTTQCYSMNTVIDMPHHGQTVALAFQPQAKHCPLAATAGKDGKFKIWVLNEIQAVGGTKTAWACQSVGYYNETPCTDAVFSEDGQLLAVPYSNLITLWTPGTNVLQKILHLPFPDEKIRHVAFGHQESSHYLIVSTNEFLIVWNLLTCTILWTMEAMVTYLLPDPNTKYFAAFIVFDKKSHLYLFDPLTPHPVAIQSFVSKKSPIFTAAFDPNVITSINEHDKSLKMSKLYFLTRKQELYSISSEEDNQDRTQNVTLNDTANEESSQDFLRVFGQPTKTVGESSSMQSVGKVVHGQPTPAAIREMLSIPSHVLPPVSALCSTFLKSLLVSKQPPSETTQDLYPRVSDDDPMDDESDSDAEPVDREVQDKNSDKQHRSIDDSKLKDAQINDEVDLKATNYSWLKEALVSR